MTDLKRIRTALISVYDKEGLEPIIQLFKDLSVKIISTGGTKDFIEKLGVDVTAVEDLTTYPSILGGKHFIRKYSAVYWQEGITRRTSRSYPSTASRRSTW